MNNLEKVSEDERGWIYRLLKPDGREVILIFTRRGFWRGGEYHKSTQHDFLIFGKLYWLRCVPMVRGLDYRYAPESVWSKLTQDSSNPTILLDSFEGHVVRADEDTLYVEWLDGPVFEKTFIPEMRKRVDEQLKDKNR
jgi:hypothetical protein